MAILDVVATMPFILHMVTSYGVISSTKNDYAMDSLEYWKDVFIDCFRLGPTNGSYVHTIAYLQGILPIIGLLFHLSTKLQHRKFGYLVLTALYFITQIRLILFGYGIDAIAYLYIHIVIFSVLVLYNDVKATSSG
ncbi:hypothetical protein ACF0H5_009299 [Mactra antiquata]